MDTNSKEYKRRYRAALKKHLAESSKLLGVSERTIRNYLKESMNKGHIEFDYEHGGFKTTQKYDDYVEANKWVKPDDR